ncbi:MAG: DUF721 domain-containing protein [Micromonosporaceae bacterium]|nr:DUF721 domain-containing protein [Micromonosporaceae bacterium]
MSESAGGRPDQHPTPVAHGPALASAALDAALAGRRGRGWPPSGRSQRAGDGGAFTGGAESSRSERGAVRRGRRGYTGPGPDPRDPQPFSLLLGKLVRSRGWQQSKAEATVFGAWERVVGAEVAAHSHPIKLERGELTVQAESTAWATQLRLLSGRLLTNIGKEIGRNVVTRLHIHGPAAPSWSHGPRRVRGRGPRDTYG